MAIATECPLCLTKGQVPDAFKGRRVKCPKCCNLFVVGGGSGSGPSTPAPGSPNFHRAGAKTQPEFQLGGGSHAGTQKKPSLGGSFAGNQKLASLSGSQPGTVKKPASGGSHAGNQKIGNLSGSNAGNNKLPGTGGSHAGNQRLGRPGSQGGGVKVVPLLLGIGAIFFALAALVAVVLVDIEYLAVGVASLALLCGLGGIVMAAVSRGGWGAPLIGSLIAAGALAVPFMMPASKPAETEEERFAREFKEKADQELAKMSARVTVPPTTDSKKTAPTTKKDDPPPEWTDVSKGLARHGDVRIAVRPVEVRQVKGKDGKIIPPGQKQLVVHLQIDNAGKQKLTYHGSADPTPKPEYDPRLIDDNNRPLKSVTFGKDKPVEGQAALATIEPSKSVSDVLVFAPPDANMKFLRLEFPASRFGGTGQVKMQIPTSMVVVRTTFEDPIQPVGPDDPKTIAKLREALKSPDAKVKLDAVGKLGAVGPKAAAAVGDLAGLLKDPNEQVRSAAALALGKIGPQAGPAVPQLSQALKDTQPRVRGEAALALGEIGPAAKPAVSALITAFGDPDEEVARRAFESVKKLEGPAPPPPPPPKK